MAIVALASCDALFHVDAVGIRDASTALPKIIQIGGTVPSSPTGTTVLAVQPTRAGDLLVVATASTSLLASIDDDAGSLYVSANATFTRGQVAGEVWYVASGGGGATTLTITDSTAQQREVWFLEIAGVGVLDARQTASDASETGMLVAPAVTPSRVPAVIVAVINVDSLPMDLSPDFTPLPLLNGDPSAYAVVTAAGTYGPTWTTGVAAGYGAATLAFVAN
jgi:hypothetical protein